MKNKKSKEKQKDPLKDMTVTKEDLDRVRGFKNTLKLIKMANLKPIDYIRLLLLYLITTGIVVITAVVSTKTLALINEANFGTLFFTLLTSYLILMAFRVASDYFTQIINVKFENKMIMNMAKRSYKRVLNLEVSNFDVKNSEEFQSRINAAESVTTVVARIFSKISAIISNLAYTIILFVYSPILSAGYAVYSLINIILNSILWPRVNALYNKNWKENGLPMNALSREAIIGVRDIKSLNMADNINNEYFKREMIFFEREENINRYSNNKNIPIMIFSLIKDALIFFGGYLLYKYNMLTIAHFMVFLTYSHNIWGLFNNISDLIIDMGKVEAKAVRSSELFEDDKFKSEKFGSTHIENLKGKVELKNLNYKYIDDDPLFENVSFNIEPNQITALVGRSGEGKTTILSLINKFYEVKNGQIFIDGVDVNELDEPSLRGNIAYIQQSPYIFNASFRQNMHYVKPDATEDEIISACKKSEIYDFIKHQKDGLDTIIGENGITLSGGQKQRLAIARALLCNSKIIMFDESTSSLDNESQLKIQKVIERLAKNHTIIVVAHRLTTIKNADKIIYFKDHKVVAEGTHDELIETCGDYKNLYQGEDIK